MFVHHLSTEFEYKGNKYIQDSCKVAPEKCLAPPLFPVCED